MIEQFIHPDYYDSVNDGLPELGEILNATTFNAGIASNQITFRVNLTQQTFPKEGFNLKCRPKEFTKSNGPNLLHYVIIKFQTNWKHIYSFEYSTLPATMVIDTSVFRSSESGTVIRS